MCCSNSSLSVGLPAEKKAHLSPVVFVSNFHAAVPSN